MCVSVCVLSLCCVSLYCSLSCSFSVVVVVAAVVGGVVVAVVGVAVVVVVVVVVVDVVVVLTFKSLGASLWGRGLGALRSAAGAGPFGWGAAMAGHAQNAVVLRSESSRVEELKKVIARCDVLSINDEEARQLTGEHSLVKAAREILEMGPKYLIIKKGEHGALLFGGDEMFFAPALPLENVVDPTGAGDTFAGGLLGYIASQDDISFDCMKRAVIAGSALASFTVEKFGTERLQEIEHSDVHRRIAEFQRLVQVDF